MYAFFISSIHSALFPRLLRRWKRRSWFACRIEHQDPCRIMKHLRNMPTLLQYTVALLMRFWGYKKWGAEVSRFTCEIIWQWYLVIAQSIKMLIPIYDCSLEAFSRKQVMLVCFRTAILSSVCIALHRTCYISVSGVILIIKQSLRCITVEFCIPLFFWVLRVLLKSAWNERIMGRCACMSTCILNIRNY
jgi:hypothetical protein